MRLKRYITEAKGSYLDNKKMPKEGQEVYALVGFERKVVKGKVKKLNNIDNRGLANTYLDLDVKGKNYHVDISQVYDHKPKQVKTKDEYGDVTIWEGTYNITPGNSFDSEWHSEKDDDFMTLEKQKGGYYGHSQDFDFERKSKKEAYDQLKKWGYKKIS